MSTILKAEKFANRRVLGAFLRQYQRRECSGYHPGQCYHETAGGFIAPDPPLCRMTRNTLSGMRWF